VLLAGLELFAGGLVWDPANGRFGEILPSVPLRLR
jgi:hypothetical protein